MGIAKDKWIYFLLTIFIALKMFTLHFYNEVWWDPAVYIGMGKYIFSFGNAGFWEDARPIAWPIMLGFMWKIGLSPIFFGRILDIVFGLLSVYMTYRIGSRLFDRKTALIASAFLAVSPTFFFFSGIMLTETVSTFFSLLAINLLISKKYRLSGFIFGIAFMTRFLQFFAFMAAMMWLLLSQKKPWKPAQKMALWMFAAAFPYLVLNAFLYSNPIHPFLYHIDITQNSGWDNYHPITFYISSMLKENILYLLSIAGLPIVLMGNDRNKKLIASLFAVPLLFFLMIRQKEMRFLIMLMPYMYLLLSHTLFFLLRGKSEMIIAMLALASLMLSLTATLAYYKYETSKTDQYAQMQQAYNAASGEIWVSGPGITAYSDKKAHLLYYPFFNEAKKTELAQSARNADYMFVDSCDIGCRPEDTGCEQLKEELWQDFSATFRTTYYGQYWKCKQFILER